MKRIFKFIFPAVFFIILASCNIREQASSIMDQISTSDNTTATADPGSETIENFSNIMDTATQYSYTVAIDTISGGVTTRDVYLFAKSGDAEAMKYISDENSTSERILHVGNYYYFIDETAKTATKMLYTDGEDMLSAPNLDYITDFDPDNYAFVSKTANVAVSGVNTTCYDYYCDSSNINYKYYVADNGYVVMVTWTSDNEAWSVEIQNFKTTDIDTAILEEPSAADYTIEDLTA